MAFLVKFQCSRPRYNVPLNLHRRPLKNLWLRRFPIDLSKPTPVRLTVIRASSSSPPSNPKPKSLVKTTFITLAAIFSASLYLVFKPTLTFSVSMISQEATLQEAALEKHLETQSNDVEALLSLTKIKFESDKYDQAIETLNRLMEIEPDEPKWPAIKARILSFRGQSEPAIKAFEEILLKDPFRVDAYHYLVMEHYDSMSKLTELENRIDEVIRTCKKKKKTKEIRGFKMLIAQIRVLEGNTVEALRICQELEKDDPKDIRTYLFQALVYSLMKKGDEASKQYDQFGKLLQDDPYLVTTKMNARNISSEWRIVLAYDNIFCYLTTFAKLSMASAFNKFKLNWN